MYGPQPVATPLSVPPAQYVKTRYPTMVPPPKSAGASQVRSTLRSPAIPARLRTADGVPNGVEEVIELAP